ncbi:MAG: hypothetical protein JWP74_1731 [Marmoricola sp.]|nr:hypothetical protein [Marmoricola sp.]
MSLPEVTIAGRATNDAELRATPSGVAVANFRVACNDSKRNDDGTYTDLEALFVNVAIWKDAAEAVAEHVRKGTKVVVTGRLYQREYETNGEKRTSLELKFATCSLPIDKPRGQAPAARPAADPWATPVPSGDAWAAAPANSTPPF